MATKAKVKKQKVSPALKAEAELVLKGGADGDTLMPPSVAQGLVSREEFVNLLIVTYTEKLEAERDEKKKRADEVGTSADVRVRKLYSELMEACRSALRSSGVVELQSALRKLTGSEIEVFDGLSDKINIEEYMGETKTLPPVRFTTPDFGYIEGRENPHLVDVLYRRIFGVPMPGRPEATAEVLPVNLGLGGKPSLGAGEKRHWMHPMDMMEAMCERAVSASAKVQGQLKVPAFEMRQAQEALDIKVAYMEWNELKKRVREINDLLASQEKLRRKALAVMTAQAIGAEGVKQLPQLDVKL